MAFAAMLHPLLARFDDRVLSRRFRMAVVLASGNWPVWLGEEPTTVPQLGAMLAPYPWEEVTC